MYVYLYAPGHYLFSNDRARKELKEHFIQELRLEDLKHLRDSVPKVVNNGGDAFISQLLDVSSITYQDVISAADTLTVYPGPTEAEQIIFSSSSSSFIGSSPVTMVQSSRPPNRLEYQTLKSLLSSPKVQIIVSEDLDLG